MTASPQDRQRHRADIDGLRAIAVLAVVLYHLKRSYVPGGYLGVDMFFVLSGYLIAGIIWRDMRDGDFSILHFYERRIRRIMPALLLVLLTTTIASAALLLPADLANYGKSIVATLVFIPNVYFWRDTNYFSSNAEEKPLLHMWSLGVEEQFYVLFPLILWMISGYRDRTATLVVALLVALSLASHVALTYVGGGAPAFYFLPSRAWELGAGALLVVIPLRQASATMTNLVALLGAYLIGSSLFGYPASLGLFPVALPVIVGTTMVIWAGTWQTALPNRALAVYPLVFVGLISYSLYLWHWPIIVLSKYYLIRDLSLTESASAVAVMFGAASLSWRFVELPFRGKRLAFRAVRTTVAAAAALLFSASAVFYVTAGLPNRLNAEASIMNAAVGTNYRCGLQEYLPYGASRSCAMNLGGRDPFEAELILLGNSHAQMYAPVWRSILEDQDMRGLLVPQNGCLPTVAANISVDCVNAATRILDEIATHSKARTVVIALTWHQARTLIDPDGAVLDNTANKALNYAIDDLVRRLAGMGKAVLLIGPIAIPGVDIASITGRELAFGRRQSLPGKIPVRDFLTEYGSILAHFADRSDVVFARPDAVQCGSSFCYFIQDGVSFFADSNHIAAEQSLRFKGIFAETLTRSLMQKAASN